MEQEAYQSGKLTILWSYFLNSIRRLLRNYKLAFLISALRRLVHFGPWRVIPQFLIRQFRPVLQARDKDTVSLLDSIDVDFIAEDIRQNSFSTAGVLHSEFVSRMRAVTDRLPSNAYKLMHHIDENVLHLSEDPTINDVLHAYFKCEPVLLESTITVTGRSKNTIADRNAFHIDDQNVFHFDYAGWESLNVFVYLSDVTDKSAYHSIAKGSHRNIGLHDALRGSLTDDEALHRFGSSVQNIMGPAGTLFFENTESYHRRQPSNQRRVLLNLLYTSHRGLLSHGRTSSEHIKKRKLTFDKLKTLL